MWILISRNKSILIGSTQQIVMLLSYITILARGKYVFKYRLRCEIVYNYMLIFNFKL